MNKRELGTTGIQLSELCYGCTAQYGKDFLGKQSITEETAFNLVSTAFECGISFFDTGFNYGYAEERLGRCLSELNKTRKIRREDIIIQTKGCETLNNDGTYGRSDYSSEWIKKSIDISLKRLQTDYIDLFALHGANISDISDELIHLFSDLKDQGVVRAYGVSGASDEFGWWVCQQRCFDYLMITYNYTESRRNKLIESLYDSGIGVLAGASLNRSFNARKKFPKTRSDLWYMIRGLAHFRQQKNRSKKYGFVSSVADMTPQQVSLSYILHNKCISSASFNTINVDHLKENVLATEMVLSDEIISKIEEIK